MISSTSEVEALKAYLSHVPVDGSSKAHVAYVRLLAIVREKDPTFQVNYPQQLERLKARDKNQS